MSYLRLSALCFGFLFISNLNAQETPILNYSINENGQVLLEVNSDEDHYYSLRVRHDETSDFDLITSLTLGSSGTTIISEPLSSYPLEHYQVMAHEMLSPSDLDGDGQDDILELNNTPYRAPLNYAAPINFEDGYLHLENSEDYSTLSVEGVDVPWAPFLNGKEFMKFAIVDPSSNNPKIYFMNLYTITYLELGGL